jgi:SHS2 domain-containing protein
VKSDTTASGARWEHFAHGADIGVRGIGPTIESAFEQAAIALTAIVAEPSTVRPSEVSSLECEAPEPELLLVDWLNLLIYEMATRRMLFRDFAVEMAEYRLRATVRGEPIDPARHSPAVEAKGATYTALSVRRDDAGGWVAECVVDV